MKINANRSAKNCARCRRSKAVLNLVTERDSFNCDFKYTLDAIFRQLLSACVLSSSLRRNAMIKQGNIAHMDANLQ